MVGKYGKAAGARGKLDGRVQGMDIPWLSLVTVEDGTGVRMG